MRHLVLLVLVSPLPQQDRAPISIMQGRMVGKEAPASEAGVPCLDARLQGLVTHCIAAVADSGNG